MFGAKYQERIWKQTGKYRLKCARGARPEPDPHSRADHQHQSASAGILAGSRRLRDIRQRRSRGCRAADRMGHRASHRRRPTSAAAEMAATTVDLIHGRATTAGRRWLARRGTLMSISPPTEFSRGTEWPRDLAWVACQAATELDNLILGRSASIDAVKGLTSALSSSVVTGSAATAPASLVDPTTTVVLTRALRESEPNLHGRTLEDLVKATVHLVEQLRQVAEPARTEQQENTLRVLRGFCLALSRHAAAVSPTPSNRPEHPFRR